MSWTHFWDMHSGGSLKEPPYGHIAIEAAIDEAEKIFQARFGHDPRDEACTCCGTNYSIYEYPLLSDIQSLLARFGIGSGELLVVPATEIKDEEKSSSTEGRYVYLGD